MLILFQDSVTRRLGVVLLAERLMIMPHTWRGGIGGIPIAGVAPGAARNRPPSLTVVSVKRRTRAGLCMFDGHKNKNR